jgi:hypothetical protein
MTDRQLQLIIQEIASAYLGGYRRQKARSEKLLLEMESLAGC